MHPETKKLTQKKHALSNTNTERAFCPTLLYCNVVKTCAENSWQHKELGLLDNQRTITLAYSHACIAAQFRYLFCTATVCLSITPVNQWQVTPMIPRQLGHTDGCVQSAYAKDDVINRVCHKTQALCSCRRMSLPMRSANWNKWLQVTTLMYRSICSTSAVTGLTVVGDRQCGLYFALTTMWKAGQSQPWAIEFVPNAAAATWWSSAGDASRAPAVRVWHESDAAQVIHAAAQPHLQAVGRLQHQQCLRLQSAEHMLTDVSEQFLNGTSAHIRLFSAIRSFSAVHGMIDLHKRWI